MASYIPLERMIHSICKYSTMEFYFANVGVPRRGVTHSPICLKDQVYEKNMKL